MYVSTPHLAACVAHLHLVPSLPALPCFMYSLLMKLLMCQKCHAPPPPPPPPPPPLCIHLVSSDRRPFLPEALMRMGGWEREGGREGGRERGRGRGGRKGEGEREGREEGREEGRGGKGGEGGREREGREEGKGEKGGDKRERGFAV